MRSISSIPGSLPLLAALLLAILVAGPAAAEKTRQEPRTPLVLEWLTVEAGGAPLTISLWLGGHTWVRDRYLVGVRAGARQTLARADLDGDGSIDFAKDRGNNPVQYEVAADLAIPIRRTFGHEIYGQGARQITRDARGRTVTRWTKRLLVPTVRELSIATGVRLAVLGDQTQIAIPLGLRTSNRARTRGRRFKEWWLQARALFVPQAMRAGADLEGTWMLRPFGLSLFFEYFPKVGETDPAGPRCTFGPRGTSCDPATPVTAFNRIPDADQLTIGLRVRLTWPR